MATSASAFTTTIRGTETAAATDAALRACTTVDADAVAMEGTVPRPYASLAKGVDAANAMATTHALITGARPTTGPSRLRGRSFT